jgi:hypothetical protein
MLVGTKSYTVGARSVGGGSTEKKREKKYHHMFGNGN